MNLRIRYIYWPIFLISLFLFTSCGKEQFGAQVQSESFQGAPVLQSGQSACANSTLVKPKVDFLFLIDNSSSTNFLTTATKSALKNIIYQISDHFNFHVMVAPLLDTGATKHDIIVSDTAGLSAGVFDQIRSTGDIDFFSFPVVSGPQELGFQRTYNLISNNRTNGIFRTGSYLITVVVSNGDDTDVTYGSQNQIIADNYNQRLANLKTFTKRYSDENPSITGLLKAQQLRFMSIVPHADLCQSGYKFGRRYRNMSRDLYQYSGASDQGSKSYPDSYDLCTADFSTLFEGINSSIQQVILAHKYNWWPISVSNNFDPDKITVAKSTGQVLIQNDSVNGFVYHSALQTNRNTRYEPSPGEPFTGYMIELFGSGRVTYPECLIIKTQTPAEYYGYIVLTRKPDTNTLVVKINGQDIPANNSTNGWTYQGFNPSINIRVVSKTNDSPATPAITQTGYVIKLHGTAIYSNNDVVEVYFNNAGN